MIKSIEFDNEYEDGYIRKHNITYKKGKKNRYTRSGYDEIEVYNGFQNPQLIKNLLGKKFVFDENKINVFFGPNGSGKTTIIKTIASYAMCGNDGLTSLNNFNPCLFPFSFKDGDSGDDFSTEKIEKKMAKNCGNKACVEWDGYPTYFHNFKPNSNLDTWMDSIVDQGGASVLGYIINEGKMSLGENTIYFINRIVDKINSMQDIDNFKENIKSEMLYHQKSNDVWKNCFEKTYDYWNKKFIDKRSKPTILLDEIDKSLDILNVINLYAKILPKINKKYNCQFIMVTHSPFILINSKKMKETYNVISLDEDYTNEVKEQLKKMKF